MNMHEVQHSPQEHSPLGGSGAYRWMPEPYGGGCVGSVRAARGHDDPESEYAAEGTVAHAVAAYCLADGSDAWTMIGFYSGDNGRDFILPHTVDADNGEDEALRDHGWVKVTKEMVDAVQVYLDAVRGEHPDQNQGNTWVERFFHATEVHEDMYGRGDFAHLESYPNEDTKLGEVVAVTRFHPWDYKHGAGIVVEVQQNPQLMYYAVGLLTDLHLWDQVDEVVLHVSQPRGFHNMGPNRDWTISTVDLATWRDEVLVPAMGLVDRVSRDTSVTLDDLLEQGLLVSGEHCRFCPARFGACPALVRDMKELEEMVEMAKAAGGVPKLTNEQVGHFLTVFESAKIAQKAARETGFMRAQEGHEVPGWKIVNARKNRVWRDGALAVARKLFKKDAMTTVELKSPAQLEALPGGKKFTSEWAFKPQDAGFQLVKDSDNRPEAGPKARAMFEPVKAKDRRKK